MASKKEKNFFSDNDVVEHLDDNQQDSFFHADDLSDEDRANIMQSMGANDREVGTGEALLSGAKEGTTLGFNDELAGLAGAAGYSSVDPNMSLTDVFGPEDKKQKLLDIYRQSRDEERANQELAKAQHPIAHFGGNMAGAALLPIPGVKNLAGAGLKQAIKTGTKVGAGIGAVAGAGGSEADLTQMTPENAPQVLGELGMDVGTGATVGAATGVAAPIAIEGTKGTYNLGKKLAGKAAELPFIRDPMTALRAGLEGRLISTESGRRELAEGVRNTSSGLLGDIRKIKSGLSSQYDTLLSDLEKKGVNIESKEVLEGALKELGQIKSNPKIDDATLKEVSDMENVFSNYLNGREQTGVDTRMTPAEGKAAVNKFKGKADQLKEYDIKDLTRTAAKGLDKQLNEITPLKDLDTNYKQLNDVMERLRLDLNDRTDSQNLDKLAGVFTDIERQTKTGDKAQAIMNEVFPKLELAQPGITAKYKPQLEKFAKELEVNQQARRPIYGRPIQAAGYAGYAGRKLSDVIVQASDDLVKSTPEALRTKMGELYKIGSRESKELANILDKLSNRDARKRQALIFGLMQNPKYRELLGVKDEMKADESGQ